MDVKIVVCLEKNYNKKKTMNNNCKHYYKYYTFP